MGRIANNNHGGGDRVLTDLCCDIYQGEYVLVIGGDVILKPQFAGGNSQEYIIQDYFSNETLDERTKYLGRSAREHKIRIRDILRNEWRYDADELSEDLVSLLSTKCFRVVITTTFDGYLETLMRSIFGNSLRVMNLYDTKDIKAFCPESEYNSIPPTLYYAFGKADSGYDYVFSENDAIKAISRWLSNYAPLDMIEYLKNKKILAIGCKFDDWYFRFFWYCLRQDFEHLSGDVAISLQADKSESDRNLAEYLAKINVGDKGNSKKFIHELSLQLSDPDNSVYSKYRNRLMTGGVFISYASEDFPIVCQIYSILSRSGIKVWFDDKELSGGDRYDVRISNAISECRIFIPVLSGQTKYDIANGVWRYYKDVEWPAIEDNKTCSILPVTLSGFDIRSDREGIPDTILSETSVSWTKDGGDGILDAINRLMRRS